MIAITKPRQGQPWRWPPKQPARLKGVSGCFLLWRGRLLHAAMIFNKARRLPTSPHQTTTEGLREGVQGWEKLPQSCFASFLANRTRKRDAGDTRNSAGLYQRNRTWRQNPQFAQRSALTTFGDRISAAADHFIAAAAAVQRLIVDVGYLRHAGHTMLDGRTSL